MNPQSLEVNHISVRVDDRQILFDISCSFDISASTVLMGPNGSGKSTLSHVIMGDPRYVLVGKKGTIRFMGKDITSVPPEEKSKAGLFLSFQSPIAIPGVSVKELLRAAMRTRNPDIDMVELSHKIQQEAQRINIDQGLLKRSIHEDFSGGERKKIELLQALILQPKFAIFDEIDTGVDVDALKIIGEGIMELKRHGTGILIITHNERIMSYVDIDATIVMQEGRVIKVGDRGLMETIQANGYEGIMA